MADNNKYFQGITYSLAGAGAVAGATSFTLKSMTDADGVALTMSGTFGTKGFGTIEPGNSAQKEQISFTGLTNNSNGTVTLTGVKSVTFAYPYTETSGLAKTHAGATTFVISNTSGFYNEQTSKNNDETVNGDWNFTGQVTFANFPITPANSNASTTVKGVTKLSVAPLSPTDPIALGTNDNRALVGYAVDAVGTDSYAITPTPAITAYAAGQVFTFKAGAPNTGACTLAVSGLAAIPIKKNVSSDLVTGDILLNQIVVVEYDGTNMQLASLPSGVMKTSDYLPSGKIEVDATEVTLTGTLTETTLFDVSVPGGLLLTNNAIRVKIYFSNLATKAAETTTFRLKYGGSTLATAITGTNVANIAGTQGFIEGYIVADASASAQKGVLEYMFYNSSAEKAADANVSISKISGFGSGTGAVASGSSQLLEVTAQQSTVDGNNSLTAEFWVVEIIRAI